MDMREYIFLYNIINLNIINFIKINSKSEELTKKNCINKAIYGL